MRVKGAFLLLCVYSACSAAPIIGNATSCAFFREGESDAVASISGKENCSFSFADGESNATSSVNWYFLGNTFQASLAASADGKNGFVFVRDEDGNYLYDYLAKSTAFVTTQIQPRIQTLGETRPGFMEFTMVVYQTPRSYLFQFSKPGDDFPSECGTSLGGGCHGGTSLIPVQLGGTIDYNFSLISSFELAGQAGIGLAIRFLEEDGRTEAVILTPEPSSWLLSGVGVSVLAVARARRRYQIARS